MTTIEDLIRLEYESLRVAIFPREKQEHADKIVQLEKKLAQRTWVDPRGDEIDDQG